MTNLTQRLSAARPAVHAGLVTVVLIILLIAPLQSSPYRVGQLTSVLIYAIVLIGLNLVTGFGGIISLGHGALFAVGAYTTAVLVYHFDWPIVATLPISALVTALLSLLIGIPTLRLRGLYLALVTVGVAVVAVPFFKRFDWLGASEGLTTPSPDRRFGLDQDQGIYYLALVVACIVLLLTRNLVRSGVGRAVRAASDNELAAATYGINIPSYRLLVFVISGAVAGLAGGIQTMQIGFVSPDSFTLMLSLAFFIGVVVGGLGSVYGPLIGALFIEFVPIWAGDINQSLSGLIYGVILVVVLLVAPQGVTGVLRRAGAAIAQRTSNARSVGDVPMPNLSKEEVNAHHR